MATLKPFASNPVPFGTVTVAAANTPVRLTSGFTDMAGEGFAEIRFVAVAGNTGANIYILSNSSAKDTTNFTNIILVIPKGNSDTIPKVAFLSNAIIASTLWVDADTSGDKVYLYGFQI